MKNAVSTEQEPEKTEQEAKEGEVSKSDNENLKAEQDKTELLEQANAVFGNKIKKRVKVIIACLFALVFLFSFFAGTYSLRQGIGIGIMLMSIGDYIQNYFLHFGLMLKQAFIVDAGGFWDQVVWFFSCLKSALIGDDVARDSLQRALFNIRLPRIMLVILVGAALSTAGAAFQGMFKNPLVSPDLLGASAGASLGACLMMLADMPNIGIQLGAFIGGLLAVGLTVWMRGIVKSDAILGLVLAGMLVSTLFSSGMSFVKLVADTNDKLPAITYWLMGSFSSADRIDFWLALIPMLLGFGLVISQSWKLNVMSFGDDEARSMGVDTRKTRLIVILGATLITSTSVAVAGVVGWVGLVIPHFARAVVGPNYKVLLPTCLIMGAAYLLCIDDIARMLLSVEIPIGILTSILGVPFFLVIFRNTNKGW